MGQTPSHWDVYPLGEPRKSTRQPTPDEIRIVEEVVKAQQAAQEREHRVRGLHMPRVNEQEKP